MRILIRPRPKPAPFLPSFLLVIFVLGTFATSFYFFLWEQQIAPGILTASFGITTMLVTTFLRFRPLPLIVLDDRGIYDRRKGWGVILWKDLEEARIEMLGPFLCLRVRNPELYLSRLSPSHRQRMEFNRQLGFQMLILSVKNLNVNPMDLLAKVREQMKKESAKQNSISD